MRTFEKNARLGFGGVVVCVMALTFGAVADDAVGVFRVKVPSNEAVTVSMPFSPIGRSRPESFISGPFSGVGGEGSDRLYVLSSESLTYTNAFYSPNGWLDPATGQSSSMAASFADTLVFSPGIDVVPGPFSFSLFGRASGVAVHSGSPKMLSMRVDPNGEYSELSLFTRGIATDLFSSDFETDFAETASWRLLGRHPGHPAFFSWRDSSLPGSGGRIYLAADATRDTDGDGLPDELESRVYGTSPFLPDTDGDGISDRKSVV